MTVSAAAAKAGPYTGNDSASAFDFAFKVFADTDIRVVATVIATSVESDLVLNTDYTVARNVDQDNDPGGTVTYKVGGVTTAYPSTHKLTIVGDFVYEQPTDVPNGGSFFATVIENALDRLTMLVKQEQEKLDRAVTVAVSDTTDPADLIDTLVTSSAAAAGSAVAAAAAEVAAEAAQAAAEAAAAGVTKGLAAGNVLQVDQAVTTVASATSTALAGTNKQYITGTTQIGTFTGTAGVTYHCENASLLPLVHSAGLSILNWGLNATIAPGSTFDVYMATASTCVVFNIQYSRDYKRINTANGYGSTNNAIRRLTNIVDNTGGSVTYADSAGNGASFTVNATGLYSMSYSDQFNASANMGISLNSNQLTTSIQNITQAHILAMCTTPAANVVGSCSANGVFIAAGGVVRPHAAGTASGTTTSGCIFTMARVG